MTAISITTFDIEEYDELLEVMKAAYPEWPGNLWRKETLKILTDKFPDGQFVLKVEGRIAGAAFSMIINKDHFRETHTYQEITDQYTFRNHDENGTILYGLEIFIHPKYRGNRFGNRLYDARKNLCEKLNLEAIIFGGRIPNYVKYASEMSPKEYIMQVRNKIIYDPVLSFQLSNDFHVRNILKHYMPEDKESFEYAILLQWNNVYYDPASSPLKSKKRVARIGLVQWKMRVFNNLEELYKQLEFFVDSVSSYRSDFCVFPELFNAPLLDIFRSRTEAESMRMLASVSSEIKQKCSELAVSYNVNIITGSMPEIIDDYMYNVGYICHRSGKIDRYEKIHITPDEKKYWGLKGGTQMKVFSTDAGRVGVLICYDSEFPELSRLLADQGMQILFVPYLVDTQNAYMRVRLCSQARAVENECYVAITGSTGNLPEVTNMDVNYSQAAVFTPSDFAFPYDGVKSEATPNTEMVLIADVDLKLLDELHAYGSVRNLKDRRTDFYKLEFVNQK